MLAQDALDQTAQVGTDILAQRPVDGDVALHGVDQFAGDVAERVVAKHLDRAVVGLECVVEGELVLRQPEFVAPGVGLAHLAGKLDQLLDHLHGLDGAALITA